MTIDPIKIVGAQGNRHKNDFYPTPRECTEALDDFLAIRSGSTIWEPAAGQGHIVKVLRERGYNVIGTDIITGVDFLTADPPKNIEFIITNPPFSIADKFIKRAADLDIPFAFLLKIQYWNSAKRLSLFNCKRPMWICPLTWRPDFTGQKNSLMDVMWCIWGRSGKNDTIYRPLPKPKKRGQTNERSDQKSDV